MSKDIEIRMSTKSLNDAIKELKRLEDDFMRKFDIFVRILVNDGVQVARTWITDGSGKERDASVAYQVDSNGDIAVAMIEMTGKDVLFVEFGAGIYYNPSNPPHATKYGMGVGTYPGQTHAFDKGWWYYGPNGESVYTHGTEGTYPMYHASENIQNNAIKKALQIFRS